MQRESKTQFVRPTQRSLNLSVFVHLDRVFVLKCTREEFTLNINNNDNKITLKCKVGKLIKALENLRAREVHIHLSRQTRGSYYY